MPIFKRLKGKPFGVVFSKAEQAIIDEVVKQNIMKSLAEFNRENFKAVDSAIIYLLHTRLGISIPKLKQFYRDFRVEYEAMQKRYELGEAANAWLFTDLLKRQGIDLEAWEQEVSTNEGES